MQTFQTTFRNIVSSAVSSFARTIDGKYPTDEDLQKHREVLNNLKDEITEIRQQFTLHGDNLMCASESAVVLSKSVAQFYQQAENSEITKSIQSYNNINEEIANRTVRLFQQQLHTSDGLISELDNWLQVVQLLQQKIEDAERIHNTVQHTSDRLNSLKEQCDRLKKKQASGLGGSSTATAAQEIRELEERIQEITNTKNAATKEFQDQKQLINEIVTQMLKDKYRIFDRVYVQLLECQLAIIGAHFNLTKPFRTSVDDFRKKYKNYEESATSHPLNILTEKLLLHNKTDRKSTSNRNQSERNKQREQVKEDHEEEEDDDDEENDRKVNKKSNNHQENNTAEKNKVNNQNGDNNNNTETNGTGNHTARNGKSANNTNNSAESKNKAPPVPVQPPPPLPGKNKAPTSTSASQQDHNDFLFGDFTSPTSSVNSTLELEDQEFGDFMGHNPVMASTTATNENNKPKMERKDSGDFWGMFGSANDGNKSAAEKAKSSSGNPSSNSNPKPESEASRKSAGGDRGNNQPSIPQAQPSKITDPDKIRQKVLERIRFVNESYEREAREQAERNKYKDELEIRLDEWEYNNGVRRNIRSLLTKLPEILWEDSGWKPVSLGDLVQPVKCKKAYQIAVRVVHPDRAANRGDDMKKTVICERVFTALNEAWKEFENTS